MNNETLIVDLEIEKGDTVSQSFICENIDLSLFISGKMYIKDTSDNIVISDSNISVNLNKINNVLSIAIDKSQTNITAKEYLYELEISSTLGAKYTILKGKFKINNSK